MGRSRTADPPTIIKSWTAEDLSSLPPESRARVHELQRILAETEPDQRWLKFTKRFPLGAVFTPRNPHSDLRMRIIAVEHEWSGNDAEPVQVFVTFEDISSGHILRWPAATFHERWQPLYPAPPETPAPPTTQPTPPT